MCLSPARCSLDPSTVRPPPLQLCSARPWSVAPPPAKKEKTCERSPQCPLTISKAAPLLPPPSVFLAAGASHRIYLLVMRIGGRIKWHPFNPVSSLPPRKLDSIKSATAGAAAETRGTQLEATPRASVPLLLQASGQGDTQQWAGFTLLRLASVCEGRCKLGAAPVIDITFISSNSYHIIHITYIISNSHLLTVSTFLASSGSVFIDITFTTSNSRPVINITNITLSYK